MSLIIPLKDLFKKIDLKSTLMVLPSIDKLLELNKNVNPTELRIELLKQSIDKWHSQVPLILQRKFDLFDGFRIRSNFESYCKGLLLDDNKVTPEPTKIISINGLTNIGGRKQFGYFDPSMIFYGNGLVRHDSVVSYIAKLPLFYEFNDLDELTDESSLGFLEDRRVEMFVKQCLLDQLDYVSQLNRNFEYPMLPVQLFNGLDEKRMELKQDLEIFYTGLTHGASYF